MKQQELRAFTAPSSESIALTQLWISSYSGVSNLSYDTNTQTFSFDVLTKVANDMLEAEFGIYQNPATGTEVTRSLKYSLPQQFARHISLVHPVSYFPRVQAATKVVKRESAKVSELGLSHLSKRVEGNATELLAACQEITPTCIAAFYNIDYTPPTDSLSGSMLGVTGFLEQYINHTDINSFVRKFGNSPETRANPGNFTVELVNGGLNNESYYATGVEATLDMEYSMPFTGSLPVT